MTYYVTGYYQGKSILKREDHLFFLKCEEAEAPTGTMVEVDAAKPVSELSEEGTTGNFSDLYEVKRNGANQWKQRKIWKDGVRADVR
mgnify:CR=1 FL=1